MKKHYAFIPLQDKDLSTFRKSLITSLSFRPVFAFLKLCILGFIGYTNQELLTESQSSLFIFSLASAIIFYLLFMEIQKIFIVGKIHKSSLLPFIRVRGSDDSYYMEEVENGFIVQIEPVNLTDVSASRGILSDIVNRFTESSRLASYLRSCMDSKDDHLINKAVIYVEIIRDQLEKGNKDILATYDKLKNFKGELY